MDEMGIYSTRAFSARATKLISEHDFESKPLFLYLPITAPHQAQRYDPVQVPRDAEKKATVGSIDRLFFDRLLDRSIEVLLIVCSTNFHWYFY